nr:plant UBX domain-containing protein 4-like [Tanacetum cinerariifolium]
MLEHAKSPTGLVVIGIRLAKILDTTLLLLRQRKSECPREFESADKRSSVNVNLIRRDENCPVIWFDCDYGLRLCNLVIGCFGDSCGITMRFSGFDEICRFNESDENSLILYVDVFLGFEFGYDRCHYFSEYRMLELSKIIYSHVMVMVCLQIILHNLLYDCYMDFHGDSVTNEGGERFEKVPPVLMVW